ncbi:MAG TPA: twin-arginine translocase subunit TatC, partial [Bacteroidales bacterium]|nr:twin-arginine translocase subunit TatC [Bacteroidales bacterium]
MAKQKQSDKEVEMSFWEHLEELRWHIVRSVIAVVVLSVVAFLNRKLVFDMLVLAPGKADFFTNRMLCKAGEWLNIEAICMDDLNL